MRPGSPFIPLLPGEAYAGSPFNPLSPGDPGKPLGPDGPNVPGIPGSPYMISIMQDIKYLFHKSKVVSVLTRVRWVTEFITWCNRISFILTKK